MEYTAPELLLTEDLEREYSEKSDMWSRSLRSPILYLAARGMRDGCLRSLGMVVYAMSFSSLPFSHDDPHVLKADMKRFGQSLQISLQARSQGLIKAFVEEKRRPAPNEKAPSAEDWLEMAFRFSCLADFSRYKQLCSRGRSHFQLVTSEKEDASGWLPFDTGGRIGPLRLAPHTQRRKEVSLLSCPASGRSEVLAALLALDARRRPAATDLPSSQRQLLPAVGKLCNTEFPEA